MLGGDLVHQDYRLLHRLGDDDGAALLDGLAGNRLPGEFLKPGIDLDTGRFGELLRRRDEDGTGHLVMLRLGEEIDGHMAGVGVGVGENADLARSCDHVDLHVSEDHLLRRGDEDVAGSGNDVDFRNGLRTVGHGGDGARSADLEDVGHAAEVAGRQQQGIGLVVRRRRTDDDLLHAGHLGRDDVHQQ